MQKAVVVDEYKFLTHAPSSSSSHIYFFLEKKFKVDKSEGFK